MEIYTIGFTKKTAAEFFGAVILSVGLTRAFTPSTEKKPMHWLQVNNVHSDRDPTWQLG